MLPEGVFIEYNYTVFKHQALPDEDIKMKLCHCNWNVFMFYTKKLPEILIVGKLVIQI